MIEFFSLLIKLKHQKVSECLEFQLLPLLLLMHTEAAV